MYCLTSLEIKVLARLVLSEGYEEESVPYVGVLQDSHTWASSRQPGSHKNKPRPFLKEPDWTGLEWDSALVSFLKQSFSDLAVHRNHLSSFKNY